MAVWRWLSKPWAEMSHLHFATIGHILEHFLEFKLCILYLVSKLGNSGVQRFKWCANWSWNEEIMAVWRQPHQAVQKFRSPKPISQLRNEPRNEIHLRNFSRCFAASKPPPRTRVPLRKLKLHPQAVKQVANHLQVAESPPSCKITNSTLKNGQFNVWNQPVQSQIFATD